MLKSPKYTAKLSDEQEDVFIARSSETTIRAVKAFTTHWAVQGMGLGEHLVNCGNMWDVHPINNADPENYYKTLAESARGPVVIALQNSLAVQFHVNAHYPITTRVLQNFVLKMMQQIHSVRERMDITMAAASLQPPSKGMVKGGPALRTVPGDAGKHFVGQTLVQHSGYAFSKRGGPLLVTNNATTADTVKAVDSSEEASSEDSSEYVEYRKKSLRTLRLSEAKVTEKTEPSDLCGSWSPQAVREFLHPGYLSLRRESVSRQEHSKKSIKCVQQRPYCAIRKSFSRADLSKALSDRVRASIRIETPYTDPDTMFSPRSDREKWVSRRDYRRVFQKSQKIDLPVLADDARPLQTVHSFRKTDKTKWLGGHFKAGSRS